MPSLFRRAAALLFLLSLTSGCATTTRPATNPDALLTQRSAIGGPNGYLALTASFDLKSFTAYPSIELELTSDQGDVTTLKIGPDDLLAFPKAQETVPLTFALPVGTYRVTRSSMSIPGGSLRGRAYEASEHVLSVEKDLQPFKIEEGRFTHLAVFKFAMTESVSAKYVYYYSQTSANPTRPEPSVWAPYRDLLAKSPGTYLKKGNLRSYTWPEWTLAPLTKEERQAAVQVRAAGQMLDPAVIQRVTQGKRGEVGACHLHYSPKASGRLDISYVIRPDGKVKEAKLTKSTLDAPKTEGCILGIVKKLQFPKPPSGDSETWTLTWDFNAAQ
jgi:hypothetical protein